MNNELFKFPFISGVWGTVSDWVMVIVTAITAIFLYRTLREQQNITKIELERFAMVNPPTFQVVENVTNPNTFHQLVTLRLTKSRVRDLKLKHLFSSDWRVFNSLREGNSLNQNDDLGLIIFYKDPDICYTDQMSPPPVLKGYIILTYGDMLGNRYRQSLKVEGAFCDFTGPPYQIS